MQAHVFLFTLKMRYLELHRQISRVIDILVGIMASLAVNISKQDITV